MDSTPSTVKMATAKKLDELPEELVSNIAGRLHADDMAALRLTARKLEAKSFHEFAKGYFSEKCFIFTTDSLKVLLEISRSKRLRGYLHHVHLLTALFSASVFGCPSGCRCAWQPSTKQREAYRDIINDQSALMETGQGKVMVTEAFSNLTELQTISFDDSLKFVSPDVDLRGANKVPRLTGRPITITTDKNSKEYTKLLRHMWEVMMHALEQVTTLQCFQTNMSKGSDGVPISFFDSKKYSRSLKALQGVKSARLVIRTTKKMGSGHVELSEKDRAATEKNNKIMRGLGKALKSVEDLDLAFDNTDVTGPHFAAFALSLNLSNLQKLYLEGLAIPGHLLALILPRLESIKDLHFLFVNLTKGTWVTILKVLQGMTSHLQHLHLMFLLEENRKAYFLKQPDEEMEDPNPNFEDDDGYNDDEEEEEDDDDDAEDEFADLPDLEDPSSTEPQGTSNGDGHPVPYSASVGAFGLGNALPPTLLVPLSTYGQLTNPTPNPHANSHSTINHVRDGDPCTGERGYYVCVQGAEIAAQLPTFIEEYNLGEDLEDEGGMPGGPADLNAFMNLMMGGPPPPQGAGGGNGPGGTAGHAGGAIVGHAGFSIPLPAMYAATAPAFGLQAAGGGTDGAGVGVNSTASSVPAANTTSMAGGGTNGAQGTAPAVNTTSTTGGFASVESDGWEDDEVDAADFIAEMD